MCHQHPPAAVATETKKVHGISVTLAFIEELYITFPQITSDLRKCLATDVVRF